MKRIYIMIVAVSISLLLNSCSKDFITQTPAGSINEEEALTDEGLLMGALNGTYSQLRTVGLFGRDLPVIGDVQADNTYVESRNSGRYLTQFGYNVTVADDVPSEIWSAGYTAIMRANRIIDADVEGENVAAIKAAAYGIRALVYFKLVNVFARPYTDDTSALGIPVVLHYNPYDLPSRSSVGTVYNQIISDCQAGFASGPDFTSSVYLSKYAIEGVMAKAYLYMGKWAEARDAAIDVIESSEFSLVSYNSYRSYWDNPAPNPQPVETLFEVDANVFNNNGYDDLAGIYFNGYSDIYASSQLYALYGNNDIRKSVMEEGTTKSGVEGIIVTKYPNAQNSDRDNLKVMRLSEVYLIAAEAAARLGDNTTAQYYLNGLMTERDPSLTYTSTGDQLISDVITERRKELAFEGDRLFDLNRLMLPIERVENAASIPANLLEIPYSDYRRIYPIPQDEIQANPNLANEQNPGY